MSIIKFDWDPPKNIKNHKKHKVWFEEAETVFFDENAIRIPDDDHSWDEERWLMLGMSSSMRILVVCHCYREDDELIWLISAWKADGNESKQYLARRTTW